MIGRRRIGTAMAILAVTGLGAFAAGCGDSSDSTQDTIDKANETAQKALALLPKKLQEKVMLNVGSDRLAALMTAIDAVRRGGTISISGVYGAPTDPLPMFQLFDKQVQLRMGQANVRRWSDDILAVLEQDEDVLGVESFATHHLSLDDAPEAYQKFRDKEDGMVKVVFNP